ncbi:MAG TPA: heavy metal-binding domain-containing protein [Steroidobacteraceae bacterium]|nr:heavy metal-binding domain-containing protein [Steroidobacteraceae bacterium]
MSVGILDRFNGPDAQTLAERERNEARHADIVSSLQAGRVPGSIRGRLEGASSGALPWIATLTPSELLIVRSHGLRPIAAVSATCWLHYGYSWTEGHAQGWETALRRLCQEAQAAGANAVLDVKMRTVPIYIADSMDFTLVGTAVRVDGLPPSAEPIVATVPALQFVQLLEADVVPTGIAIGAHYEWMNDWRGNAAGQGWWNNEARQLSMLWEDVRQRAHADLRQRARARGNGVLAHLNFSQMFEREMGEQQPRQFLARHIVIATTVDARRGVPIPHDIKMVVDTHAGGTPLTGTAPHHQSYATNEVEGAI